MIPQYQILESTQKPILISTGELDDYDLPSSCNTWKKSLSTREQALVEIKVYQDAYHAFNSFEQEKVVIDPFSHLGQGGEVLIKPNPTTRKKAKRATVKFFKALSDIE